MGTSAALILLLLSFIFGLYALLLPPSLQGELAVGKSAPDVMTHSLLYTLCYHGFGDLKTHRSHLPGYDRVRGTMIGRTNIPLQGLEEVLTTEHWIVRVYKLSSVDVLST